MPSEEKARKSLSNEKSCYALLVQTEFNSKDMSMWSYNNSTERVTNCVVLTKKPSKNFHSEERNLLFHTLRPLAKFFHSHVEINIKPSLKLSTISKSTTRKTTSIYSGRDHHPRSLSIHFTSHPCLHAPQTH